MYYEVYADSLFLLHFFLNLYLLELVNHMLYKAMDQKRIVLGALAGAGCSLIPFLAPMKLWISMLCSFGLSLVVLCVFTFRAYKRELFICVLEKLVISTLLLGGMLLFLIRILPKGEDTGLGIAGILALGSVCYVVVERLVQNRQKKNHIYKVTLHGEKTVTVNALLDTGNSLTEPISGKPVAVLEYSVFEGLYEKEEPKGFRMIPYHSIDKEKGMLPGYLLNSVTVDLNGIKKEYQGVYVGVSRDIISKENTYQMILNPQILE